MDHGSEAARTTTTVESTDVAMAGAVQGGLQAHTSASTFHGHLGAAAAPRCASFEPTATAYHHSYSAEFARHVRAGAAGRGEVPVAVLFHREPAPGGEVFVGQLTDGVFAQQTVLGTGRAADGMVAEHLRRRLLPFAGIGVSSLSVNGLAAGPGSPAVAFHLFVMLLGGLFLLILHVLRV